MIDDGGWIFPQTGPQCQNKCLICYERCQCTNVKHYHSKYDNNRVTHHCLNQHQWEVCWDDKVL